MQTRDLVPVEGYNRKSRTVSNDGIFSDIEWPLLLQTILFSACCITFPIFIMGWDRFKILDTVHIINKIIGDSLPVNERGQGHVTNF